MTENEQPSPSNPRRDRQRSDRNLLLLVIFALVVLGGGIIAGVYGPTALVGALPCLLGASALIFGLWGLMVVGERWRNRLD